MRGKLSRYRVDSWPLSVRPIAAFTAMLGAAMVGIGSVLLYSSQPIAGGTLVGLGALLLILGYLVVIVVTRRRPATRDGMQR